MPVAPAAVIYGDPNRSGTKVMPHWHPDEWRTAVVLSGTLYFSIGVRHKVSEMPILVPTT